MKVNFAPLEGLTDDIFRQTFNQFYGNINEYYMPFFSPTIHRTLTPKEMRELPIAASRNFKSVPQIMTKDSGDFVWAAQQCADRGYTEVNLNAGCPSGTVFAKGKGAGLLTDKDHLDRFLEKVCSKSVLPISIKTRIGISNENEFSEILAIYNRYPLKKIIIHPRLRNSFYKGTISNKQFQYAYDNSKNTLEFNGDIKSNNDIINIANQFPALQSVMIGRGLIKYPGMLTQDKDKLKLKEYHDTLLEKYIENFRSDRNAIFRMKEHWFYLLPAFENSEKIGKRLRKTTELKEYKNISNEIFDALNYIPE